MVSIWVRTASASPHRCRGPAIGGEGKGNFVFSPTSNLIGLIHTSDAAGIVLALIVQHRGDVVVRRFCLDNRRQMQSDKQRIVHPSPISSGGVRGQLGNGEVPALDGTCSFGIRQIFRTFGGEILS